jgi:5-methylcytosine-specific restriction enzyme A
LGLKWAVFGCPQFFYSLVSRLGGDILATYLLTWNPARYKWGALSEELSEMRVAGRVEKTWSVGNSKRICGGDRFFMIRLGSEPRGIVGAGTFTSAPFEDRHWDRSRAQKGDTARYASIEFDCLSEMPIVDMKTLTTSPYDKMHWSSQTSGISVPEGIAMRLEREISSRAEPIHEALPGELRRGDGPFREGAVRAVLVDAYERSSEARKACIAAHGVACAVCNFKFGEFYGAVAANFIHVHHLTPISENGRERVIDPIRDLVPVCPNCHAVIHLRNPPYSVAEVKGLRSMALSRAAPANPSLERP